MNTIIKNFSLFKIVILIHLVILGGCKRYGNSSADNNISGETSANEAGGDLNEANGVQFDGASMESHEECGDTAVSQPTNKPTGFEFPREQWQTTDPASVGFTQEMIDKALSGLKEGRTNCALIVKDGKIVGSFDKDKVGSGYSTGKSVLSAAIGIAFTQGHLTMDQKGPSHSIREHLQQKLGSSPWKYEAVDGQTNALKILDTYTPGGSTQFVQNELLTPLGMTQTKFGGGILGDSFYETSCSDLGRFGLLMQTGGTWDGKELINSEFWDMATEPVEGNAAYGFLFWLNGDGPWSSSTGAFIKRNRNKPLEGAPDNLVYAKGFRGQVVMAFPSEKLVVVRMGSNSIIEIESMPQVYKIWDAIKPLYDASVRN